MSKAKHNEIMNQNFSSLFFFNKYLLDLDVDKTVDETVDETDDETDDEPDDETNDETV